MANTITARDIGSSSTTGEDSQVILTGTPTANSYVEVPVTGSGNLAFQISGTWTGTIEADGTLDGGTTWIKTDFMTAGVNASNTSVTGNGLFKVNAAGYGKVRLRSTAAMTGTATITYLGTTAEDVQHVIVLNAAGITIGSFEGVDAAGAAPTGNPVLGAGSDGSAVRTILTDSTGRTKNANNADAAASLCVMAAAAASTINSADQVNYSGKGVKVVLDLTTTTTASVVAKIQGKDVVSGKYYDILTSAAKTSNSTTVLTLYPGGLTTANVASPEPLPRTWRVSVTISDNAGTAAVTGTVGASVLV